VFGELRFPDWSQWNKGAVYTAALVIAAVASLETLLNLEAVDKLDPKRRGSPSSRELMAQGVGNVVCGLIGGLPVTSVIVRSSVNINAGGQTKLSAIWHGLLLCVCVVFAAGVAIAVLAGMVAAPVSSVYPGMGNQVLIVCFVVVVIGGIGSVRGALLAALLIGIVDTFGKVLLPQAAGVLVYVLMALILLWKPDGLFKAA
jgi:branched-chain amino acid transport system permease protein